MSPRFLVSRCAFCGFCLCTALPLVAGMAAARGAEAPARRSPDAKAPQLVQAALDAELAGNAQQRAALLAEAIAADPEFAPARWAAGQVKFDGEWRTPAQVQTLVTYHHRWTDYRKLRDSLSGTPADHERLAIWCHDNSLANEERYHWANVLLASPKHKLARERLGLEVYRGGLFTHEQVVQFEKRAKDAEVTFDRLKPKFTKLCRDAATGEGTVRTTALDELSAVSDPAAMEALETAVNRQAAKTGRATLDLNLALVAAFANMPQHEATLRLLNHAVFNPLEQVRVSAAMSLKKRPPTDYVPLLMAALQAPIELKTDVLALPDGTVRLIETTSQQGAEASREHTQSVNFETEGVLAYDPSRNNPGEVLQRHASRAAAIVADDQQRVETANAAAQAKNNRIAEVLKITTEKASIEVEEWWSSWKVSNELQYSELPVNRSRDNVSYVYAYKQGSPLPIVKGEMHAEPSRPPVQSAQQLSPEQSRQNAYQRLQATYNWKEPLHSCFKAGTPVWTQGGPIPIERVDVGDFVLCQSPLTGEVSYRPVMNATHGDPTRVVRLKFGDELIITTLGHRFWVDGRGWEMAKFLTPGDTIHALGGPISVEKIAEDEQVDCYNLVVDEFHTFFVGDAKILVHDIGCPLPVIFAVPGSATERAPWSPRSVDEIRQVTTLAH